MQMDDDNNTGPIFMHLHIFLIPQLIREVRHVLHTFEHYEHHEFNNKKGSKSLLAQC